MRATTTDLPFKMAEERIVILKQLPVLQCEACREYLIEDTVMARIDELLARRDSNAELEVIRYAA
jgi:YgiT-type zinc finger domain-containing protein